jgi:hypothetical protein
MSFARIEQIANAILYEGYMLYPYRGSSLKNQERWTFGVLLPRAYSQAHGGSEAWSLHCECLFFGGPSSRVELTLRFLHPISCTTQSLGLPADGSSPIVSTPPGDDRRPTVWQEAIPYEAFMGPWDVEALEKQPTRHAFAFGPHQVREEIGAEAGGIQSIRVKDEERIDGVVEVRATCVAPGVYKLMTDVSNLSTLEREATASREKALLRSLVSTHALLALEQGEFISLSNPPPHLHSEAQDCHNVGLWPILVGDPTDRNTVLCSPIILEDHPQIAPESPGDLFDATEIDEILTLRVLTLTDTEREEAATDPRVAALLARTHSLTEDRVAQLHGALRATSRTDPPRSLDRQFQAKPGDRVRLLPQGRADILDLALAGQAATIVSVEEDYEGQRYVTVTIDADPGKDLGQEGRPGHRFFFRPEEIEPIVEPAP